MLGEDRAASAKRIARKIDMMTFAKLNVLQGIGTRGAGLKVNRFRVRGIGYVEVSP